MLVGRSFPMLILIVQTHSISAHNEPKLAGALNIKNSLEQARIAGAKFGASSSS